MFDLNITPSRLATLRALSFFRSTGDVLNEAVSSKTIAVMDRMNSQSVVTRNLNTFVIAGLARDAHDVDMNFPHAFTLTSAGQRVLSETRHRRVNR